MGTLFDEFEIPVKRTVGNPYHSRKGRYTDKSTAAKEKAEKRADVAENRLEYTLSCYFSISKLYSHELRKNEALKEEVEKLKSELSRFNYQTA